ncbi:hypothetical protein [Streptomyces sp. NPDC002550]
MTDPRGIALHWVLVRAPLVTRWDHVRLAQLADDGCRFAGVTSHLGFPGDGYRDERDYGALCEAWLHCFREPDRYLPPTGQRLLVSESDFTDPMHVSPARIAQPVPHDLVADVVHVSGADRWPPEVKNWPLAARCLPRLAQELGLRVLVVDAPQGARPLPGVRLRGRLEWPQLLAVLARARCVFVPAVLDASPRLLTEALSLDVPIVVNRAILGGWKYVNPFTGVFFDGEDDVVEAVRQAIDVERRPRSWFMAHYGPPRSGFRVRELLSGLDPGLPALTHVLLTSESGPDGYPARVRH